MLFTDKAGNGYFIVYDGVYQIIKTVYKLGDNTTDKVSAVSNTSTGYPGVITTSITYALQPNTDVLVFTDSGVSFHKKGVLGQYPSFEKSVSLTEVKPKK